LRDAACCSVFRGIHCNMLQHTVAHCNILQDTMHTRCNTMLEGTQEDTLQQIVSHCKTLQHTATRYNTLKHTHLYHPATQCSTMQEDTLQQIVLHCNTLQRTATRYNTLQHTMQHNAGGYTASHCISPQGRHGIKPLCSTFRHRLSSRQHPTHCSTMHCNTLQHTAARCNSLLHLSRKTWHQPHLPHTSTQNESSTTPHTLHHHAL